MVGKGADRKSALANLCSVHVKCRSLHLNTENAKLCPLHGSLFVCVVEGVGGKKVTNAVSCADLVCLLNSNLHHLVACDGSKCTLKIVLNCKVRVCACAHAEDDVTNLNVLAHSACRADTHDILNAEELEELVGIDADRGHTHTGCHYRNGNTLPEAGVALNTTNVVNELCIGEEGLCDELCSEGVAGHKHGLGEIAGNCLYMRGVKLCVIHCFLFSF